MNGSKFQTIKPLCDLATQWICSVCLQCVLDRLPWVVGVWTLQYQDGTTATITAKLLALLGYNNILHAKPKNRSAQELHTYWFQSHLQTQQTKQLFMSSASCTVRKASLSAWAISKRNIRYKKAILSNLVISRWLRSWTILYDKLETVIAHIFPTGEWKRF